MRKGYLAIFLVLMMAIGVASSAQAYDNMAEPSAAVVIPFVVANTTSGRDQWFSARRRYGYRPCQFA